MSLRDPKAIQGFLDACRDAKPAFLVGSREPEGRWWVSLEGPQGIQLECCYDSRWREHIFGHFAVRHADGTAIYHGAFVSRGLRLWFLEHVAGPDGTPVAGASAGGD
ncbi:MAG: hypothetical protein JW889_06030 [Verrucomicrobia bacterium]|nr:hypothetical protein [Verrucomicrobiota bacterium]